MQFLDEILVIFRRNNMLLTLLPLPVRSSQQRQWQYHWRSCSVELLLLDDELVDLPV